MENEDARLASCLSADLLGSLPTWCAALSRGALRSLGIRLELHRGECG